MKKILFLLTVLFLPLCLHAEGLAPGAIESAYSKYLQGDYEGSRNVLVKILDASPTPEDISKMQDQVGVKAVLEMGQNQFLKEQIRFLSKKAWQYNRGQFKNPRRIKYYLDNYLTDLSIRGKSLMNLVAAGEYATPSLMEHLGKKEVDIVKRGLAYQALLRIGEEAVPGLLTGTYSKDPILLVNLIRLLGETMDRRILPYLQRLLEVTKHDIVRMEARRVLEQFDLPEGITASRLYIQEACRYLRDDKSAYIESISSDGLIWEWNEETQMVDNVNILGQEFEFLPSLPPSLWPIFKAESILHEVAKYEIAANADAANARAALVCSWVSQEHRIVELLRDTERAKVTHLKEVLTKHLKRRSLEVEVAQWVGLDTLMIALDLSNREFSPYVSARLLQILTEFHPAGIYEGKVISFVTQLPINSVIASLNHPSEMVRYWAAIALSRSLPNARHERLPDVMDLLLQATDEVTIHSVLLVAEVNRDSDNLRKSLERIGYKVYLAETGYDGINAIREFPSKDIILLDPNIRDNLSALEFVNQLQVDYKGKDIPLGILSTDDKKSEHLTMFRDYAKEIFLAGEADEVLKSRMIKLEGHMKNMVFTSDIVNEVSVEALKSMTLLNSELIRPYSQVIRHLNDLLLNPFHQRDSQILAVAVLEKFGEMAYPVTPTLLDKLGDETLDDEFKLQLLATMRKTSKNHPGVRIALAELVANHQVRRDLRMKAASFLGQDHDQVEEKEKQIYQKPYFSRNYPND